MANDDVDFSKLFNGDDDDDDMFYIDMNTVQKVLDEDDDCDFLEKIPDDSSSKDVSPSRVVLRSAHMARILVSKVQLVNSLSPGESDEVFCTERTRVSKHEVPACSVESSFPEAQSKNISICRDNLNPSLWKGENEIQFKHFREDVEFENTSISSIVDNDDINIEGYVEDITRGVSGNRKMIRVHLLKHLWMLIDFCMLQLHLILLLVKVLMVPVISLTTMDLQHVTCSIFRDG
ncbi:uncharacterized protein HKW66_Vig0201300 [Vigna angularis]|uniref:Uncharacterized protein n=1 Tax=Phaseolus angularis TaxID=3914 RepID=A0A8T0JR91_PHAAN|nr:uncharacterized protein HKW66_Vig0201300 [Vigna angularis]